MSTIFGICKAFGEITEQVEMERLAAATIGYAPDGTFLLAHRHIGMGYQPYHTHALSHLERQPARDTNGNLLVLDGRIDNRFDLRQILEIPDPEVSDAAVVLAAFDRWGEHCFSRLVGDWSIALWSDLAQTLFLARDHAGTRTLYFREDHDTIQWSTYLETFSPSVTSGGLDEAYVGGYLGLFSIRDRTPYRNIRAVPPAHYLVIRNGHIQAKPHWKWMASDKIRYKCDADYDCHFLSLFRTAVERRTGPGAPVLAQLSGGIDSTAIVCMSDYIRRGCETGGEPLLDTVSYFDDTEPNWNERPYFSITESFRGKMGIHIDGSEPERTLEPADPSLGKYLVPGADSAAIHGESRFHQIIGGDKYRVILSGIGGDEFTGGVPTPSPELADLLVAGRLTAFSRRAAQWCLATRNCLTEMIAETIRFTVALYFEPRIDAKSIPCWITPRLRNLCIQTAENDDPLRTRRIGISPSAILNGLTWWAVLETLPHLAPPALTRLEYRYPYLDRDLVDFLFRVPPEQLLGPNRRRLMMRRALKDIVPTQILERKRKAYVSRSPLVLLQKKEHHIQALFAKSLAADFGLIDQERFLSTLSRTAKGADIEWWSALMATVNLELWLRSSCQ